MVRERMDEEKESLGRVGGMRQCHSVPSPSSAMKEGRLPIPVIMERLLSRMKRMARYLRKNGITLPGSIYLLARLSEHVGLRTVAMRLYATALRCADASSSRFIFGGRQSWEFQGERNLARLGRGQVVDPLFDCNACPDMASAVPNDVRRRAPGYYQVFMGYRGVSIDGFLRPGLGMSELDVLVDGKVICRLTSARDLFGFGVFALDISRAAVAMLPSECDLSLRLANGDMLLHDGCGYTKLHIPHGRCSGLVFDDEVRLDKKGFPVNATIDIAMLHRGFMEVYGRARDFFDMSWGRPLFVLYGTLLGQHRNQGIIPGDDDFDVGYYSDADCSRDVLSEGMAIAIALVEAGFIVTVNRGGRLFRLRLPGFPPACHLDVHAIWHERDRLWVHPMASLDCNREDFLPARRGSLNGMSVYVPNHPEAFLEGYYGADWHIPNPAYSTAARRFPRWKLRFLKRSCVTPKQLTWMHGQIKSSDTGGGALIATGLQSIYPLERYEELCDW